MKKEKKRERETRLPPHPPNPPLKKRRFIIHAHTHTHILTQSLVLND